MPHQFEPTILREYDIRGIVGTTLSAADARAIGQAYALTLADAHGRRLAVGYDGRLTSPELEAALVDGVTIEGMDLVRIGLGPTPMLYYAAATLGVDGGIMVTGSHNPPDHNGFKFVFQGRSFYGAAIQRLGETARRLGVPSGDRGRVEERMIREDYVARLARDYHGGRPLSVAWDAGNGVIGEVIQELTGRLPGRHILLNETIDGTFPAHHPDPTIPENLVQLQQAVTREHCHLGIAFDGDGDRIGVVDGRGRILWGDQLMVLFAWEVLAERPGATVIADVKASQVLFDEIKRAGGAPLMWRTGHSVIKAKMAETSAPLAGEMSGHIFFADRYFGYDDALYAAVRILGIVSRAQQSLAEMRDSLPQVLNTPELRFPCSEERKFVVVREATERLRRARADMADIDGVRVRTPDGWWLLRASNTQDVLVARCESSTAEGLERLKAAVVAELAASGVAPP